MVTEPDGELRQRDATGELVRERAATVRLPAEEFPHHHRASRLNAITSTTGNTEEEGEGLIDWHFLVTKETKKEQAQTCPASQGASRRGGCR